WTPTPDVIERAQLTKFMKQVGVSTWDELYAYSINDVEKFTEEVIKFLDINFDPPYEKLLDTSNGVEMPTWLAAKSEPGAIATGFPSHAGLNITEMCLERWQTDEMKDQPAVIWEDEGPGIHTSFGSRGYAPNCLTYAELNHEVTALAAILRSLEYKPGDSFGIHLPMVPETIIILMAIAKIGGIALPVFSGYGVSAIEARLKAVGAKALFTCDGFLRRGKAFDAFAIAKEAVSDCPSVERVFVVKKIGSLNENEVSLDFDEKFIDFEGLVDSGGWSSFWHKPAEKTAAEDPLIILYTSGTTGKPKGIAHTHASFPIKAAQDMAFGTDVGKGTRISWYTDIGWMMGPWLIYGALINGATICIYDGAPDYPTPDRMWEFCAKHKVEVLGISPTLIRSLAASEQSTGSPPYKGGVAPASGDGVVLGSNTDTSAETKNHPVGETPPPLLGKEGSYRAPFERHDLSSLRIFASTGEPWNPAPWWWLFEKVGDSKLPIINYSGGTEIAGGILMGNPLLPIKPCSFPAPCPGMDVDILDENGKSVADGTVGELVIKQPWIGMARGFWQEKERYLDTYWRRFKDIWVHGDWAMRDKDGHWFILGRSDDTLKVAGKRVGPAEVESLLVAHPEVTEAAVIGVPDEVKGTAMVAFVVRSADTPVRMSDASSRTEEADKSVGTPLEAELKALVAKDMGKPLAPSKIHFVSALPKTRNAKVMRRVIRAAYLGEDPGDLSALEDPKSVEAISNAAK
ncbi:MAG: AMP-binding protein, partial [Blastocatellia bacterium]|nr:AMP-binding protein [Blastocatellia bacterium]